eukprot:gene11056-19660_t
MEIDRVLPLPINFQPLTSKRGIHTGGQWASTMGIHNGHPQWASTQGVN